MKLNNHQNSSSFKRKIIDNLDIFRIVTDEDTHLTATTSHGGLISAVSTVLIVLLILSEFYDFFLRPVDFKSSMVVNRREMGKSEAVNFNISFPHFSCGCMQFEAWQANAGLRLTKQEETLEWTRTRLFLDKPEIVLGVYDDSMGVERTNGEGCRVSGRFYIDKVPSNFVFSCRWPNQGLVPPPSDHIFHDLWFGEKRLPKNEIVDALANLFAGFQRRGDAPRTVYQYFLSIVPTVVLDPSRSESDPDARHIGFQYTATSSTVQAFVSPGLYFAHLHSPISMELVKRGETWSHFLVNVASISGGVYTVSFLLSLAIDYLKTTYLENKGEKM
jgi:hypothetical protein